MLRTPLETRPRSEILRRASGTHAGGVVLALCALAASARGQDAPADEMSLTARIGGAARARLAEPALLERVGEPLVGGRLARLLEDVRLYLKVFEQGDGDAGLGLSYDMAKTLSTADDEASASVDFLARGNVAFDQSTNPDDFQSTSVRLRWSGTHSLGGAERTRADVARELDNPEVEELSAIDSARFSALSTRPPSSALADDPDFRALLGAYLARVERDLPPEIVWDFDLHAGLESQQELSSRQWVAGTAVSGRLLSWDPESKLSRLNLFDLPAAALRWLTGQEGFRLSGAAYPTALFGLDVVDATQDETRRALTETDSFMRTRFELALESQVMELEGEALVLGLGWRYFQELDPPSAVRAADTDDASQILVRLGLPAGWALSYSSGRSPLDAEDDSTFALGFVLQL